MAVPSLFERNESDLAVAQSKGSAEPGTSEKSRFDGIILTIDDGDRVRVGRKARLIDRARPGGDDAR